MVVACGRTGAVDKRGFIKSEGFRIRVGVKPCSGNVEAHGFGGFAGGFVGEHPARGVVFVGL